MATARPATGTSQSTSADERPPNQHHKDRDPGGHNQSCERHSHVRRDFEQGVVGQVPHPPYRHVRAPIGGKCVGKRALPGSEPRVVIDHPQSRLIGLQAALIGEALEVEAGANSATHELQQNERDGTAAGKRTQQPRPGEANGAGRTQQTPRPAPAARVTPRPATRS